MPDYDTLRAILIPIHAVFGIVAIVMGIVALLLPKRGGAHPKAGRVFMVSMAVALALSTPVVVVGNNLFLLGITLLVVYHAAVAYRLARLQPPRRLPTPLDRAIHPLFGVVFLVYAGYGVLALRSGNSMGVVVLVFAGISLLSVASFHRFMKRDTFEPGAWVGQHVRGVAAAFIAALTAFTAITGPRLAPAIPAVVLWLGPTALFTPLFVYLGRKYDKRRRYASD
ncbi:hypothetical protein OT109_18285 [Phycisphaeraceae bacterium D3-23]